MNLKTLAALSVVAVIALGACDDNDGNDSPDNSSLVPTSISGGTVTSDVSGGGGVGGTGTLAP